GRVPALAAMLGIDMPPPPGPPRGARPQHGRGGRPSRPPRPPRPSPEPAPVAQTTDGAHDVPTGDEPTTVGPLASPDPAGEAQAAGEAQPADVPGTAPAAPPEPADERHEPPPAQTS